MNFPTWQDLYRSDLQGLYALIAAPILFLLYRRLHGRPRGGALPDAAAFVDAYAIAFAIETIVDPLVGGPLVQALGLRGSAGATVILIVFVLLGDFRVYVLLFGLIAVAAGRRWSTALGPAAVWTVLVPSVAYAGNAALHALYAGLSPDSIWLLYESLFAGLALGLRAWLPAARVAPTQPALRAYLRAALLYVAVYYGLWAAADALIQIGGLDVGWLVRVLPNQLYYGWWVPAVWGAFFSRRYQSTSASTQAAR